MNMKMHRGWMTLVVLLTVGIMISFAGCKPEVKYVEKEVEKVVEKTEYVCPKCQRSYDTVQKAADCCGVQTVEKEVTVYKYVCPKDKKEYVTAQEAADCCGVQVEYVEKEVEKIVKKYVCLRDGKEYDTSEDAENCCGPVINTVIKYVCPKDKKEFETAEEAADCCGVQTVEKEVTVYKYVCPKDKKEFTTAQEAADCCGVQIEYVDKEVEKVVKKYVCPRDGKEYDTAEDAENCCGPVVNTVTKYVCPKDKKEFETAEEAANCCGVQTVEKEVTVYKYMCPKDKKEYDTAEEAADCCGVQIEYVDKEVEKFVKKYVCPRDGKEYDTVSGAEECCGPVIEEKLVYTTAVKAGTYTIYHVQQKITGGKAVSDYVLEATDNNKDVAENSTLEDLKNSYTGFTAKALAQNENVLYVFYDRNTITYTFLTGSEGKLNDGTTERIVKGLYGANIPIPIASSSTHNFDGWFTTKGEVLSASSIFGETNLTVTVKWILKASDIFNWYETPVDVETGEIITSNSSFVYFGVFPKTVLENDSTVSVDETEIKVMGMNTYYRGNDGNWYAKISVNPARSDSHYSDNTAIILGTERYFKVEPIKWKVLTTDYNETGNALLLAVNNLFGGVPYYDFGFDYDHDSGSELYGSREIGGNIVYANNYKYSTIRAYLNGKYEEDDIQEKSAFYGKGFLQTAFTANAQFLIVDTEVNNAKESTGASYEYWQSPYTEKYACENTKDKIFLLSINEVANPYFDKEIFNGEELVYSILLPRITDYALANHLSPNRYFSAGNWWLRSPYDYDDKSYYVRYIGSDGYYTGWCYTNGDESGVVPALCISLQ